MDKTRFEQWHFKKRIGNHSLTGFSRAFCEVLPPRAIELEFERRSFKEIIQTLESEARKFDRELARMSKADPNYKNILDLTCILNGKIGSIRKEMKDIKAKEFAEIFTFVANLILKQDAYRAVEDVAHEIMRACHNLPDKKEETKTQ